MHSGLLEKWTLNATSGVSVMNVSQPCLGLFVDINDAIYCSLYQSHQVIKKPLNSLIDTYTIVGGNGSIGSLANMLKYPYGIFVDINFDLYVADFGNDRIQLFKSGQTDGITVAGGETMEKTIILKSPTAVVLDADGYLFIGSGPNGFRCLVGCIGMSGSTSDALDSPYDLRFDSYGNMFVVDRNNQRIQKFLFEKNSCGKCQSISPKERSQENML